MKRSTTIELPNLQSSHDRIRYIFEKSGQTQQEFAESLGIGQPHLSGLMSNRKPSKRLLIMLSEKTGANIDWLLTGEGEIYRRGTQPAEDPPELARVIDETRRMWENLEDDAERYEMAAIMLRTIGERKKQKSAAAPEAAKKT